MITAEMVRRLRERTGAGMMDCKNVLVKADGNEEKALELLREKGLASAAKKAGRIAAEGIVESYIHGEGRIGVLVEVNIETDFAAKNKDFRIFVNDIAMQIAASSPKYVSRDEVTQEVIDKEREIAKAQAVNEGKPEKIIDKIADGRVEKFLKEICLLDQPFIKDTDRTVEQLLNEKIAFIGEKISIRRFARFEMGEGLEKRNEDFACEVMKQIK